jgi:hypothetical protein
MNLQSLLEAINYAEADPKPVQDIVDKFAGVSDKLRSYYINKWAEEKGIDSDDAMFMAGYVQDGYIGAGAWNWRYVGMDESVQEAEEGRWAIYIDGKDSQVRFKNYADAGEMEDKMKKKHPEKDIECKKVELNEIEQKNPDGPQDEGNMIGQPDAYYDAEERQEAYDQLQDALAQSNSVEAEYVKDGHCPECPNVEDDEDCYGFGNYGCDDGELTYDGDTVSWKAIKDHDERQAQRQQAKANYPGDEAVIDFAASTAKQLKSSGQDPRDTLQYVNQEYPNLGRAQRASLVAKGMKKAGLTTEDQVPFLQRSNSGYKKAVDDFKKLNPGKTEEDFKNLTYKAQEKYLNKYVEGKSPHKKGTKKYKKHMAAMHAG